MRRALGISYGIATQIVFLVTVPALFKFLRNDLASNPRGPLWINALLAVQFCVPHSLLLWAPVRRRLGRLIERTFYGAFYCLITCISLWFIFVFWRGSTTIVFQWPPALHGFVQAAFLMSWVALFYSLSLTGLGYQTGLTPWWYWLTGQELPGRSFLPKGVYRWIRHPVYLSFLGLVWFTPVITADRAVLIVIWTAYIFVGSSLKDVRMTAFIGNSYREYRSSVPAFMPRLGARGRGEPQLPDTKEQRRRAA